MNVQTHPEQHKPPQQDRENRGQHPFEQVNGDVVTIPGNNQANDDVQQRYEAKGTTSSEHDLLLLSRTTARS
jgi:hypothetical protein